VISFQEELTEEMGVFAPDALDFALDGNQAYKGAGASRLAGTP
jgi:hypothetical protein